MRGNDHQETDPSFLSIMHNVDYTTGIAPYMPIFRSCTIQFQDTVDMQN
jgi:hypothetical protein